MIVKLHNLSPIKLTNYSFAVCIDDTTVSMLGACVGCVCVCANVYMYTSKI